MKTMVVYESATGFTEQYAKWIAKELDCQCKPLKQVTGMELADYERVIFGGWIMGNGIMGLEKLRGMAKPYAVFAVGASPSYDEVVAVIKEQNKLGEIPMFYMAGGFRFEKLGFLKKTILRTLKKSVSKKEKRSRQEDFMAQMLGTSFDYTEKAYILPLVEYCK